MEAHLSLLDTAASALIQALVLGGVPLTAYAGFQKLRRGRSLADSLARAGLRLGDRRYLIISLGFALLGSAAVILAVRSLSLPLEPFTRQGAAQRFFVGLGFTPKAIAMALLNGVVQTAFPEELLFRGLIAGSLSRRLPLLWANVMQAGIFLLPHLLIIAVMPELWFLLPLVFLGALMLGWIRIRSGSIVGPMIMHASGNVTMAMIVAVRTAS
jgi:membrane protease YdiL (CAAX protease family)